MFLAYFFDEIRITDISLVFLMNFFRSHSHLYIETKTNEFFSLSRHNVMAYLVEQTAKRKRDEIKEIFWPHFQLEFS